MHRSGLLILVMLVPLAVASCSSGSAQAPAQSGSGTSSHASLAEQVPRGVVQQYTTIEKEIAEAGGETRRGSWRIGYIVEAAEPWFESRDGRQVFRKPAAGETHHIEIIPMEIETGRIVPDVPIQVEVVDGSGAVVDTQKLKFYYSEFFHYANNFRVAQSGKYTLRVTLQAPRFLRHGEVGEAPSLAEGTTLEFSGVELTPEG